MPLGVAAAVYLARFARSSAFITALRVALDTLAALPSLVYGLFGFFVLVVALRAGYSLAAGAVVLALVNLPLVLSVVEQALRDVPVLRAEHQIREPAAAHVRIDDIVETPLLERDHGSLEAARFAPSTGARGLLEPSAEAKTVSCFREQMSAPAITIQTDTSSSEIMKIFERGVLSAVPVVDQEGRVAGVVSTTDMIRSSRWPARRRSIALPATPGAPKHAASS